MSIIRIAENKKSITYVETDWAPAQFAIEFAVILSLLIVLGVLGGLGELFKNTSPAAQTPQSQTQELVDK